MTHSGSGDGLLGFVEEESLRHGASADSNSDGGFDRLAGMCAFIQLTLAAHSFC
jgi:hypothetical protein